eukprot:g8734.t1
MDDWDPFADPADAPPPGPARGVVGQEGRFTDDVLVPPDPVPLAAPEDTPEIPSAEELQQQLEQEGTLSSVCPELVQAAFEGDEKKICEMLLMHKYTDVNVVCCGLHEFGPYKHFTVLDMAKQVRSPLVEKLLAMGAKPAAKCAVPPWPRDAAPAEAALPAPPGGVLGAACLPLLERMQQHRRASVGERSRLFRQMMLEWHPDKRSQTEHEIATQDGVIQAHEFLAWLTAEKPQVVLERTGDGPESFWEVVILNTSEAVEKRFTLNFSRGSNLKFLEGNPAEIVVKPGEQIKKRVIEVDDKAYVARMIGSPNEAVLFDQVRPQDIVQGFVGDCWLMSSIACMATHPSKLKSLFKEKHLTEDGQCDIFLYDVEGEKWMTITIDEFIPCLMPYLRIPLVLGFFADRHRASALREPQLQVILDAVLFEPGPWQSPSDLLSVPPETVPAPDRRHLATGAGLLFNELMRSPQSVVHAVLSLWGAQVKMMISAFVLVCGHVLADVGLFALSLMFLILAFSTAISSLKHAVENFSGVDPWLVGLLQMTLGMFPRGDYYQFESDVAVSISVSEPRSTSELFCIFLLNLLIAQLNQSYHAVFEDMQGYARLNRAGVTAATLQGIPSKNWSRFLENLKFDERLDS